MFFLATIVSLFGAGAALFLTAPAPAPAPSKPCRRLRLRLRLRPKSVGSGGSGSGSGSGSASLLLTNYRSVSLLPLFGKILERVVFDELYCNVSVLCDEQHGFIPGNFCSTNLAVFLEDCVGGHIGLGGHIGRVPDRRQINRLFGRLPECARPGV